MKKEKIISVLLFLLIFFVFNPAFSMTYEESINYAMDNFSTNSKIDNFYTSDIGTLSDSDNITKTSGTKILTTNWSKSWRNYDTYAGEIKTNSGYNMWLAPAQQQPELLYSKGITSGSTVHNGLAQAIGLNSTSTNDIVLEIWATRDNAVMQRATLNPAINTLPINGSLTAANINILSNSGCADWATFLATDSTTLANALAPVVKSNMAASGVTWTDAQSSTYANFIVGQVKWAYGSTPITNGAPWSGLGYTYNWGASANALDSSNWGNSIRGLSEYIVLDSTNEFEVGAIYSEQSYIYRVKSPIAGDSSTWNNGDFKVTNLLNSLWTGRKFQPNGNSIEVTSTGDIKDGEGILVSSLGYTLNNSGSISSDSTKKKFGITGSEDIAVLFQGASSDASSQTNTVINSGTIGSSSVTTAIKATGDTSITNSGTITGGLSFVDGTGTITATAGTISGGNITTTTSGNNAISLNNATITGSILAGSTPNSSSNIGTLNIHADDVTVGGTTQIASDSSYSSTLNIDSNTANFNDSVNVTGANSRLISSGTTIFNNPVSVSGGVLSLYGTSTMPSLSIGSTLDMQNGTINTVTSNTTTLNDDVNLYLDATENSNDSFSTTGVLTTNGHIFDLKGINLLSTPQNSSFTLSDVIKAGAGSDPISISTAQSPTISTAIGTYTLSSSGGSLLANLSSLNHETYRGQVASIANYATQLYINNILFDHINLVNQSDLISKNTANKYASLMPQFAPYQYTEKDGAIWFKPYGNFEKINTNQGFNFRNNSFGALVGIDMPQKSLRHGWKFLPTFYTAYNQGTQNYTNVSQDQNGGQGGVMGTFSKGNFINSFLAYAGGYGNRMKVASYTDTTNNWFAGGASKTAYNIKTPWDMYIQPNFLLSYNAFGKQNWQSDYGSIAMTAGLLNGLNVAPGVNLIWNKETFSVYLTNQLVFNTLGGTNGQAGNIPIPGLKMGGTYFEYGIGVKKNIKDRLSLYIQGTARGGVRTGGAVQGGIEWML